jgi:hypothetical protein
MMAGASDTRLFWWWRRDRHLLREHPYVWSRDALLLCGVAGLWLAIVCGFALLLPISWGSNTTFLGVVYILGLLLTGLVLVVLSEFADVLGLFSGPIYTWPAEELLAIPLQDRIRVACHWCLMAVLLIASLRLPYEIMIWRLSDHARIAELVDDLNTINSGLAKSVILYPRSEAALNRRPLPMSTVEIEYLLVTDRRFVDPRALDVVNSTTPEDLEIERMDRALRKYVTLKAKLDAPDWGYFRRYRNDLDPEVTPDPRSQAEQICSRIGLRELREADAVVSRILEAQRVRADSWSRIVRFASYAGIAIILAVTLLGIGMPECLLTVAFSYCGVFAVYSGLEYYQYAVANQLLYIVPLGLTIWGWCWIGQTRSVWAETDVRPSLTAAFPGAVTLGYILDGPTVIGPNWDWVLILLTMTPYWVLWQFLSHEARKRAAEPRP